MCRIRRMSNFFLLLPLSCKPLLLAGTVLTRCAGTAVARTSGTRSLVQSKSTGTSCSHTGRILLNSFCIISHQVGVELVQCSCITVFQLRSRKLLLLSSTILNKLVYHSLIVELKRSHSDNVNFGTMANVAATA